MGWRRPCFNGAASHERGNDVPGAGQWYEFWTLQWGRVLMNAENILTSSSAPRSIFSLQWGRVLMNAENRELNHRRGRPSAASMGGAAFS